MRKDLLVGLLLTISLPIFANSAADRVVDLFQNLTTIQGHFKQSLYNQKNILISESSGDFLIQRPDRFIWDVTEPMAQKTVSDGKTLWIYQPDLEQATKTAVTQQIGKTPLAILSGSVTALTNAYIIESDTPNKKNHEVFKFTAKDENGSFKTVKLFFHDNTLEEMQLFDNLGQQTQIQFISVQTNQPIKETVFNFVPPKGTDIISNSVV
jgi:outer membrane lipoprotein carrier protein